MECSADDLQNELWRLDQRGIHRTEDDQGFSEKAKISCVREVAQTYANRIGANLTITQAIERLLEDALGLIENKAHVERLQMLYGLRADLRGRLPDDLYDLVKSHYGERGASASQKAKFKRNNRTARADLAKAILQLLGPGPKNEAEPAGPSPRKITIRETPYIPRPEYHHELDRLLSSTGATVLVGAAGNGKSRLAREFIGQRFGGRMIEIHAHDESAALASMVRVLRAHGRMAGVSAAEVARGFVAYVNENNAPAAILFDNVEEWSGIEDIVREVPAHRKVFITSVVDPLPSTTPHTALDIEPLSAASSTELIRKLLPNASDDEARRLAVAVGGKPLAIEHACGFIGADQLFSVEQFVLMLESDAAKAMNIPVERPDLSLTAVYRRTIEILRGGSPNISAEPGAEHLLELLSVLSSSPIPLRRLISAFNEYLNDSARSGDRSYELARAIRVLEARKLVKVANDAVTIHPLTQAIFRSLLDDVSSRACTALYTFFADVFQEIPIYGALDVDTLELVSHTVRIMTGLAKPDKATMRRMRLGHVTAVILLGLRQGGDRVNRKRLTEWAVHDWEIFAAHDLADEDYVIARQALVETLYLGGGCSRQDYVEGLKVIGGPMVGGRVLLRYSSVARLARGLLSTWRFDELDRLLTATLDRALDRAPTKVVGDLLIVVAEMLADRGRCAAAIDTYNRAVSEYSLLPDDTGCVRGKALAYLSMADALLASDHSEAAHEALKNAQSFWKRAGDFEDRFVVARIAHVYARVVIDTRFAAGSALADPGYESDVISKLLEVAYSQYYQASTDRFMLDVTYDLARYRALFGESGLHAAEKALDDAAPIAKRIGEDLLVDRVELLRAKLRLILGTAAYSDVQRCLSVAKRMTEIYRTVPYHIDALTTAYAAARRLPEPDLMNRILSAIYSAYGQIECDTLPSSDTVLSAVEGNSFNAELLLRH